METPGAAAAGKAGGSGWIAGNPKDHDLANCIDDVQLFEFLRQTQPDTLDKLGIGY